jgi:hypothetical protein
MLYKGPIKLNLSADDKEIIRLAHKHGDVSSVIKSNKVKTIIINESILSLEGHGIDLKGDIDHLMRSIIGTPAENLTFDNINFDVDVVRDGFIAFDQTKIKSLNFINCMLRKTGLRILLGYARNSDLENLTLSQNDFGNDELLELRDLPIKVKNLAFVFKESEKHDSEISQKALKSIHVLGTLPPTVKSLQLINFKVPVQGIEALTLALGTLKLEQFVLHKADLDPKKATALGEGLSDNPTLRSVILSANNLTSDALTAFFKGFSKNGSNIEQIKIISEHAFSEELMSSLIPYLGKHKNLDNVVFNDFTIQRSKDPKVPFIVRKTDKAALEEKGDIADQLQNLALKAAGRP